MATEDALCQQHPGWPWPPGAAAQVAPQVASTAARALIPACLPWLLPAEQDV